MFQNKNRKNEAAPNVFRLIQQEVTSDLDTRINCGYIENLLDDNKPIVLKDFGLHKVTLSCFVFSCSHGIRTNCKLRIIDVENLNKQDSIAYVAPNIAACGATVPSMYDLPDHITFDDTIQIGLEAAFYFMRDMMRQTKFIDREHILQFSNELDTAFADCKAQILGHCEWFKEQEKNQ